MQLYSSVYGNCAVIIINKCLMFVFHLKELEADKAMYEEKVKSISDHANKMIDGGHFESAKIMKTVKSFCDRYVRA